MSVYTLPDLPYDYGQLEPHYSGKILELHHDKHHAAYVKGANETVERLEESRSKEDFTTLNGLEKNLAFNVAGHALHSIFWQNMSPDGGGEPEGALANQINADFGSYAAMKKQLSSATTLVQGSGWGAMAWEPWAKRLVITQIYDHQSNVPTSSQPLLVIDCWEHAYYLQYLNVRPDWVNAFWNIVNWQDVSARFAKAQAA